MFPSLALEQVEVLRGGAAAQYDSNRFPGFNLGAQNLLDKVPEDNPGGGVAGARYPVHAPYGINGGFYYARIG